MTTRVYKFGLRPPTDADLVWRQVRLGHEYQNRLVEIEHDHRARYVEERGRLFPDIVAVESRLAAIADELAGDPDPAVVKAIRSERRELGRQLRAQKRAVRGSEEMRVVSEVNAGSRTAAVKAARREFVERGLYWGTYVARENAHKTACRSSMPNFHHWRGSGYVNVQVQRSAVDARVGIAVEHLDHEKSTMVRVAALPSDQWDTRSGRRRAYTTLRVRVGSDGIKPVWAEFPMLQHRPFPPGARVKRVQVNARRSGRRIEWTADFTLDTSACDTPAPRRGRGVAGVDVGRRRVGERVRVAVLSDGQSHEEVLLPEGVESRVRKADDIDAIRDAAANELRAEIARLDPVPAGLEGASRTRSKRRLREVVMAWADYDDDMRSRAHQFTVTNEVLSSRVRNWAYRDQHLEDYALGCRRRASRIRREFYRLLARRWRETYARIGVEDIRVSAIAARDSGDSAPHETAKRYLQRLASTAEFLREVRGVFGDDCVEVEAAYSSRECSRCGVVGEWDDAASVTQHCAACGREFDRDRNGAEIIRSRAVGTSQH